MTPEQELQQKEILTGAHRDYEKGLIIHAFFKVRDRAIGEDLVQDTFMKTWRYLVKGGKVDTMKAFLYHVLNHLIIDEYRKHKTISLDVLMERGFAPSTNNSMRLFNILDGKAALLLIQNLPEKYRTILHMRFVQNLSLREISLITGQSRNTVAVQIHRGLEKLKLLYNFV
jgi:RNA polymerase sigma-70 factor (ECF subfamily)